MVLFNGTWALTGMLIVPDFSGFALWLALPPPVGEVFWRREGLACGAGGGLFEVLGVAPDNSVNKPPIRAETIAQAPDITAACNTGLLRRGDRCPDLVEDICGP